MLVILIMLCIVIYRMVVPFYMPSSSTWEFSPFHILPNASHGQPVNFRQPNGYVGFPGSASGKEPPANAGDIRDMSSIPGSGRFPGGGHGNPLQYSCLEHPVHQLFVCFACKLELH